MFSGPVGFQTNNIPFTAGMFTSIGETWVFVLQMNKQNKTLTVVFKWFQFKMGLFIFSFKKVLQQYLKNGLKFLETLWKCTWSFTAQRVCSYRITDGFCCRTWILQREWLRDTDRRRCRDDTCSHKGRLKMTLCGLLRALVPEKIPRNHVEIKNN